MKKDNIADFRQDYRAGSLNKEDMLANPIQQFQNWMQTAIQQQVKEPNAMTLATATSDGIPSARIVLLKGYGDDGQSNRCLGIAPKPNYRKSIYSRK